MSKTENYPSVHIPYCWLYSYRYTSKPFNISRRIQQSINHAVSGVLERWCDCSKGSGRLSSAMSHGNHSDHTPWTYIEIYTVTKSGKRSSGNIGKWKIPSGAKLLRAILLGFGENEEGTIEATWVSSFLENNLSISRIQLTQDRFHLHIPSTARVLTRSQVQGHK